MSRRWTINPRPAPSFTYIGYTSSMNQSTKRILLGHSPDPDDAFMFYALRKHLIDERGFDFSHELQDIQTLNERALRGELDLTAISWAAYPLVKDLYAPMTCGCSMGDNYGPMVVARQKMTPADLRGKTIAVPGTKTTAFLTLSLALGPGNFKHKVVMFDQIPAAVARGEVDAGLLIHEGQLTYHQAGLELALDLGQWWLADTGLPLPLGGNVIRRALGQDAMRQVTRVMLDSIQFSLEHRADAIGYALDYARDMGRELADEFVGMYVNHWTLDYGPRGRQAVETLLSRGQAAGLIPAALPIDWVEPA